MINKISLNNQEVYKKDTGLSSYNNNVKQGNPSFKGPVEAATAVLQFCNTNPMAGVSLIDMVTAIAPRTIVDAKTNGFAAAETFRRESSGLIVNCLIPGFIVLGVAKALEAFGFGEKGLSKMWANQEALETFQQHFHDRSRCNGAFGGDRVQRPCQPVAAALSGGKISLCPRHRQIGRGGHRNEGQMCRTRGRRLVPDRDGGFACGGKL